MIKSSISSLGSVKGPTNLSRTSLIGVLILCLTVISGVLSPSLQSQLAIAAPIGGTLVWTMKAPIPIGIEGAGGGVIEGMLYASHGYNPGLGGDNARLDIYDIALDSWSSGPPASVIRSEMAGAVVEGILYAIGGRTGPNADVEAYDPGTGTWTVVANLSTPRGGLGAATVSGKIYAVGGRTGNSFGLGSILGTNEEYDPVNNVWTTRAPMPTPLSDVYATAGLGGKVYVAGGAINSGTVAGLLQIYDPVADTWSTGAPMPTPRGAAMAGVMDNHLIVFGGYNAVTNLSTTEIYDPADDTWSTGPSMTFPASEITQGATQTFLQSATTIFAVGSGIFGASDQIVQALNLINCCVTPGDYNRDATFNIADVTAGIARIFVPGSPPPFCNDEADANGDNAFNIGDVTYSIARIFTPGSPAPICGTTGN